MNTSKHFISILIALLLFNYNANGMSIFNKLFKKKTTTETPQKQKDTFAIVCFEGDSLPAVGMFNERLVNFANKVAYPWTCSVVVRCKEVNGSGLPTDAEAVVLNTFEDVLHEKIIADETRPNAIFFGRLSWNSTRELIWKVKNPEPVAEFLQSVIDDKNAIREIDFKIEKDTEWKLTEMYLTAISTTGLNYTKFETWLDNVMQMNIPSDVVAFCFNLYEDADKKWTLELIGASSFDKDNSDWACDEVFSTRDNPLTWYEKKEWQEILSECKDTIKEYLEKGKHRKELKGRRGLTVGFVDGDLIIL